MGGDTADLHDEDWEVKFCDDLIQALVGIGLNIELCIAVVDESPDRAKMGLDSAITSLSSLISDVRERIDAIR
jgi:hypothetical protein